MDFIDVKNRVRWADTELNAHPNADVRMAGPANLPRGNVTAHQVGRLVKL